MRRSRTLGYLEVRHRDHAERYGTVQSSPCEDQLRDGSRGQLWILVLPNADHRPAVTFQSRSCRQVPTAVRFDFLCPVRLVRRGPRAVVRAPVPEAAVNEHRDATGWEHHIRSHGPRARRPDRKVDSEPKARAMERGPQRALGPAVAPAVRAHDLPAQLGHSRPRGRWFRGFAHPPLRTLGFLGVPVRAAQDVDLGFLRRKRPPTTARSSGTTTLGIVDLFSGIGGLSIGAIEGARRKDRDARVQLAVDVWPPALRVLRESLGLDESVTLELDLEHALGTIATAPRASEQPLLDAGTGTAILLAGPPCQGHSALNNSTRHDDPRNDLYLAVGRVARLLEPAAVIVENVSGVGRDKRRAAERCEAILAEQGYSVCSRRLRLDELGTPQRRVRHVLMATSEGSFDFDNVDAAPHRTVEWAIGDLLRIDDSDAMVDTPSVPSEDNEARIDWLFDNDAYDLPNPRRPECHHNDHSYLSMYGRLRWDQPAQTITSGFGSMGQGRFVHPLVRRTLTPHEAARLQFLPDFMNFSSVARRSDLATMIGNAAPPILTIAIVQALCDQGLV